MTGLWLLHDLRTRPVPLGLGAIVLAAACLTCPTSASPALTPLNVSTVWMTAPTAGSSVRGAGIGLAASTGVGVVFGSVQFQHSVADSGTWIDIGPPDTLLPYEGSWDTTLVADGTHGLRAVGTDLLGAATASTPIRVTVDNTAPTASVTAPARTHIRGVVNVTADSADATSGVAQVAFERSPARAGSWTAIGTDSSAPYGVDLDTTVLADGVYELRAVSTDVAGNTATSPVRTVRIDNTPPTGSFSAPTEGATLTGSTTVTADATDTGSGVQTVRFERSPVDEGEWVEIATDPTSPYDVAFDTSLLADGAYELRAVVTDAAGNQVTNTRRVTLDNTLHAPTIGFFDFTNAFASDGVVYFKPGMSGGFSVAAEPDLFADPARVDFPVIGSGWTGGGGDAVAPYEAVYTFDATATSLAGDQEVTIVENSGLRSSASTFTVAADATPPTTTIACNGAPCATWHTAPVSVALRAVDGGAGVSTTRFTTDGTDPTLRNGLVYTGPFSVAATTSVRARSYDALGNAEPVAVLDVRIDSTPPSGSLTAPSAGDVLTASTALLTASATDTESGIASATFQQRPTGSARFTDIGVDGAAPFEATWDLATLPRGAYDLRIVIADNAGNQFTGAPVAVTYAPSSQSGASFSLSSVKPTMSASRTTAVIVVPVRTGEQTTVRTTLLRGRKLVFTWRSRLRPGATKLRLSLPRRVLRPGRYVLTLTASGPSGKATRRVSLRAGRL